MTTIAEDRRMARLLERAATMTARQIGPRTWQVSSASTEGQWYTVHAAADTSIGDWSCTCQGAAGRANLCGHKCKVAQALAVDLGLVDRPHPRRKTKPSFSSLQAPAGGVSVPSATSRPAGESSNGGSMDDAICFEACIPLIQSAVKVAGDGGVRLTLDVADTDYDAVMDFVRQARGRTFRLVPVWTTEENNDS